MVGPNNQPIKPPNNTAPKGVATSKFNQNLFVASFFVISLDFPQSLDENNVEVTGAARLYRAASVWTAGLAV